LNTAAEGVDISTILSEKDVGDLYQNLASISTSFEDF
jgi:hypothetical protein